MSGYDEGGWWPSGTLGYNTTGRPEFVLSPAQIDAVSASKGRGRGGDTYNITAVNAEDVGRQIDKRKKLSAMRYTVRP